MNRLLVLALGAPMVLIGAAYPEKMKEAEGADLAHPPLEAPVAASYRPCRPGRGDDRCIQLYERGVRAAYARWQRDKGIEPDRQQVAMGGPIEQAAPRHSRRRHYAMHGAERCPDPVRHSPRRPDRPRDPPELETEALGM